MKDPRILLSGLPGAMIREIVALFAYEPEGASLHEFALSSPDRDGQTAEVAGRSFKLVGPQSRDSLEWGEAILAVDFSTPDSALPNAEWFTQRGIPFVMGTTGCTYDQVERYVQFSPVSAVFAPNMAAPIVLLQAAVQDAADLFPDALSGFDVSIIESHQAGKRDTSGTAKAMVRHFQRLGMPASVEEIEKVRDPARQQKEIAVPEQHIAGHAYHHYRASARDGSCSLELKHNINGRLIYARGALQALRFLALRVNEGSHGELYSMRDVLHRPAYI